jgi:hypothetical protein
MHVLSAWIVTAFLGAALWIAMVARAKSASRSAIVLPRDDVPTSAALPAHDDPTPAWEDVPATGAR